MKHALTYIIMFITLWPVHALAADQSYIGDTIEYDAAFEDTFVHLARDHQLGFVEMRAANPDVDPWIPGRGTDLILPTRHILPNAPKDGIIINLPEMRLYSFVNKEKPESYAIGIGREGLDTPTGITKVVRKKTGPTWRPTERMRKEDPSLPPAVPPGPENPLGTHALYLGWPQYAIHGTNRPYGIGRRISSGCIRLYPESITKLYESVPIGTKVTVVNQPIKVAWIDDKLYLEAHPTINQAIKMEETGQVPPTRLSDDELNYITKIAGDHKDRLRWPAIRMAIKERKGYPVEIARRDTDRAKRVVVEEEQTSEAQNTKIATSREPISKDNLDDQTSAPTRQTPSRFND